MATITWVQTPTIKEVTLPSGNTYWLKDDEVRQWIGDGTTSGAEKRISDAEAEIQKLSNATHWLGVTTTALTDGSTTNPITIGGESVTAVSGDIVQDSNGNEYIFNGTAWQALGSSVGTLKAFAYADTGSVTITPDGQNLASAVTFSGGTTDSVLGADTTFTNASSSVSFGAHTTATVLKSDVTATVPKTSSTTKYLKATVGNAAVGVATDGSAITGLGSPSTASVVKSYPGATSKLVTSSVTGVQSSTTTASKATAGTAVSVATTDTAVTVANGSLGTETSTRTADTPMWGATVSNEVLSFTFKPISTTSVTPAKSNGTITPYTFADVTVPIKAADATTVATGSLDANGSGDSVMTGLGTASTETVVTGYASPSTDTFAKTVSVTTQPTVTLSEEDTSDTDTVPVVSAVSTSGTDSVTFTTTGHTADAITALGAATAAAQSITVGSDDLVTAVTSIGTGTAAAQTFNGTQQTYTVTPTAST